MTNTAEFYEAEYKAGGLNAQRRYPNEELCRFMGRRFFRIPRDERKNVSALEVGCGSGANLWMIAAEGFDTHGIDISPEGVSLCGQMLAGRGLNATLSVGDMSDTKLPANSYDAIVDVYSSYCLDESGYSKFIAEVKRLLKPNGIFFSYTPSQGSDAFKNHAPSKLIDASTLDEIRRETSPYSGQIYPFRFENIDRIKKVWRDAGFEICSHETISRTYRDGAEYFEFVVFEAVKQKS